MNYLFIIIVFVLGLSLIGFDQSYAETIRGETTQTTKNSDGSFTKVIGLPPFIEVDGTFQPYKFTDETNFLIVETNHGTVKLNKSVCTFEFYSNGFLKEPVFDIQGNIIDYIYSDYLFSDSIIPLMANEGTMNYSIIKSINNESCSASWDGSQLTASKFKENVGLLEYKYILNNGKWKTQLEATNLSNVNNKQFGFTQTINLNRDTIHYGGNIKNLDNYDGQIFGRAWLENNQSKIINLQNGFYFDFDLGFENLNRVSVFDTGLKSSKLSFDYVHDQSVLLPGEKLIIDPTFGGDLGVIKTVDTIAGAGVSCPTSYESTYGTAGYVQKGSTGAGDQCVRTSFEFDLTNVPKLATITDTSIDFTISEQFNTINCSYLAMASQPSTLSQSDLWADIGDGTTFVSNDTTCLTNGAKTLDLGASADSDLQTAIDSSINWWALGVKTHDEVRDGTTHSVRFNTPTLNLTYNLPPDPPKKLESNTHMDLKWGAGELNGDTHNTYDFEYYDTENIAWTSLLSQSGLNVTDSTPIEFTPVKVRAYDTGALGRGCYQPVLNNTVTDNLFSNYPFCFTLNDNGKQDNDGTVTGNELYTNSSNTISLSLDGSSYVTLPNEGDYDFERTDPFSISFWVTDSTNDSNDGLISKTTGFPSVPGWQIMRDTNANEKLLFFISDSSGNNANVQSSIGSVPLGVLTHVVTTYDGSQNQSGMKIYINGALDNTGTSLALASTILNNNPVLIGARTTGANLLDAELNNLMIFDIELDSHQVSQIYNESIDHDSEPNAPTLSAIELSDTSLRFTSIAGSDSGGSPIKDYSLRCSLNDSAWVTTVSNSTTPAGRIYEYTGLTIGDILVCQWRDGSLAGFSNWSNNATENLIIDVLSSQRTELTNPDDKLLQFINFITDQGGVYFGLGVIPFGIMLIGFMAGKKTVRIFTLATLFMMGIVHASGYYIYPDWYWTLSLLFGIGLIMGRMKSD